MSMNPKRPKLNAIDSLLRSMVYSREPKFRFKIFRIFQGLANLSLSIEETYISKNKAGYTATEVAWGWAGAIFEVTRPFGQEQ